MQNDKSVNENGETLKRNNGNGKGKQKRKRNLESINAKHSYIPR